MSDIYGDIATIKTKADALAVEKVANFGYTDLAYSSDEAAGVTDFDFTRDQNVPNKASTDFDSLVLQKGLQTQAASIPRWGMNHFFGRTSYNLNKISDWFPSFLASNLRSEAMNAHLYSPTAAYKQYDLCYIIDSTNLMRKTYMRISSSPGDLVGSAPPNVTHWKQLEGQTGTGYIPYIDGAGRMGIGRAPTTDVLEVSGTISAWNGSTIGAYLSTTASGDAIFGTRGNANVIFYRNGVEKARIDTNDYFLIGYTASQGAYKLQVNGGIYASGNLILSDTGHKIGTASGTGNSYLAFENGIGLGVGRVPTTDAFEVSGITSSWYGTTRGAYFVTNSNLDAVFGSINNANVLFTRNASEVARLDTNNYFLIGYTASQGAYKLQVNGGALVSGKITFTDILYIADTGKKITTATGSVYMAFENAVGIGVKRVPTTEAFEVSGQISIWNGSTRVGIIGYAGSDFQIAVTQATGSLQFFRASAEKARIDTNDYFLLGYTSSSIAGYKLQVNGAALVATNLWIGGVVYLADTGKKIQTSTGSVYLAFENAIGIGVNRAPTTYALEVGGDAWLPTGQRFRVGDQYLKGVTGIGLGVNRTPATYPLEVQGDIYASGALRAGANLVLNGTPQANVTTGPLSATPYVVPAGTYVGGLYSSGTQSILEYFDGTSWILYGGTNAAAVTLPFLIVSNGSNWRASNSSGGGQIRLSRIL